MLAPQSGQLRPEVLDFDRHRSKLGARGGQFVTQSGDLILGRTVCQVYMAILPESGPVYKHDHTRERNALRLAATSGRAVQARMRQSIPSSSIEICAAVIVTVPLSICGPRDRARDNSSRLA